MQVRHLFSLVAIVLVATPHFAVQWFAWKVHLFEIPLGNSSLGPPADYLWKVCSWPMFQIIPRRVQHLHFLATLLANSVTWGVAFFAGAKAARRFGQYLLSRGKKKRTDSKASGIRTAPPTRVERIIELNALLSLKRITEQEYRVMRRAIMREKEPEPDTLRKPLVPTAAVTYSIRPDANGAAHVAWIDEVPGAVHGKRVEKQPVADEPGDAPAPTRRTLPQNRSS